MKILIQARMESERLPGKTLMDINGKTLLERCVRGCEDAGFQAAVLTCSKEIADFCDKNRIEVYEGHPTDLITRYRDAVEFYSIQQRFVRITADCPMVNTPLLYYMIAQAEAADLDFLTNCPSVDGHDIQICSVRLLNWLDEATSDPHHREHVFTYLDIETPSWIKKGFYQPPYLNKWFPKLSIDTQEDFNTISQYIKELEK